LFYLCYYYYFFFFFFFFVCLFSVLVFSFSFIFFFILYYKLNLGIGCNFSHSNLGIFFPYVSDKTETLHIINNCTFSNITSKGVYSVPFSLLYNECPLIITNNSFFNLDNTYASPSFYGVAMHFPMNSYCSFSGNTFYNITGYRHAVGFNGSFTFFSFSNNSFQNIISSDHYGGVCFFYFFFLLILKSIYFDSSSRCSFYFNCFVNCSGPKG
jgi:hypothetical protein